MATDISPAAQQLSVQIVEASIASLRGTLDSGAITAVELAAECLARVSHYDCRGLSLNAIPLLNPNIFGEAETSDDLRASGQTARQLEGVPYTVKDSYKVKGLTVANGSPAFQNIRANNDAFTAQKLREAGAVLIGQTNMCPMAYGGMQRGVYGRAENPYNPGYLAAAFASGSSNGSGVATAASLATFGMGSETVSSGRSPASNNSLVAYVPSRGYISARGVWPLYPTCDAVVPHTRCLGDLFELLDVITEKDHISHGDFWRVQPFVSIPPAWPKSASSFRNLAANASLKGRRIAVPSCYVGGQQLAHSQEVYVSQEVVSLWQQARADLEAQGAEVIEVTDFPLVQVYENPKCAPLIGFPDAPSLPENWNSVERGMLIARTWDAFLRDNKDPNLPSLSAADSNRMFPAVPSNHPQIAYAEPTNAIHWNKLVNYLDTSPEAEKAFQAGDTWHAVFSTPQLGEACQALETFRKVLFEDWLTKNEFDMVAFPAAGDVGRADADITHESAKHAWTNGVKYSHCNRALRHIGVPSVTVPMGLLEGKGVPMGLTLCAPAYQDEKLLQWAMAFESIRKRRVPPRLTPTLPRLSRYHSYKTDGARPDLQITEFIVTHVGTSAIEVDGDQVSITLKGHAEDKQQSKDTIRTLTVEMFVDGKSVPEDSIRLSSADPATQEREKVKQQFFEVVIRAPAPPKKSEREKTEAIVARDQSMVVVLAWMLNKDKKTKSRPSGWFGLG